jgi:PKD repeat protein
LWYTPNILYNWSWGDGTPNSTTANATHTYATGGTYTVCEEVNSIIDNQTCQQVSVIAANFTGTPR